MLATLSAYGDGVVVSHLHRQGRGVRVGDVVDFKHPMQPGFGAIKRVAGLPGDFVMRDSPGLGKGLEGTKMIQVGFLSLGGGGIERLTFGVGVLVGGM